MTDQSSKPKLFVSTRKLQISEHVSARILKRVDRDRLELAIIVDDRTTSEELRSSWSSIARIRDSLRIHQGSDMTNVINILRINKAAHLVSGMSYSEVAWETNYDVLVNLCRAHWYFERNEPNEAIESVASAQAHLLALRMKREDVASWTWSALDDIRKDRAPWSIKDGPVDKERVRANLLQLERELVSRKLVIKDSPPITRKSSRDMAELPSNKEPKALADRLLDKMQDGGGKQQLSWAIDRHLRGLKGMDQEGVENSG
jgi:hypothetical protein